MTPPNFFWNFVPAQLAAQRRIGEGIQFSVPHPDFIAAHPLIPNRRKCGKNTKARIHASGRSLSSAPTSPPASYTSAIRKFSNAEPCLFYYWTDKEFSWLLIRERLSDTFFKSLSKSNSSMIITYSGYVRYSTGISSFCLMISNCTKPLPVIGVMLPRCPGWSISGFATFCRRHGVYGDGKRNICFIFSWGGLFWIGKFLAAMMILRCSVDWLCRLVPEISI